MDLKEIDQDINIDHWYYQTKFLALKRLLIEAGAWPPFKTEENIIVDIGAGSGIFMEAFSGSLKVYPKYAYALDLLYPREFLGIRKGIHFVKMLPEEIKPNYLFFIDILEHVEGDIKFLQDWVKISQPNSYFIFSVPAFKFLWSSHDVFLEHRRRYTLKDIEKVVSGCGLKVIKSSYFFATIFPSVFFMRRILEPLCKYFKIYHYHPIKKENFLINLFLKLILNIELKLGIRNRILGVSCLVVAIKPK